MARIVAITFAEAAKEGEIHNAKKSPIIKLNVEKIMIEEIRLNKVVLLNIFLLIELSVVPLKRGNRTALAAVITPKILKIICCGIEKYAIAAVPIKYPRSKRSVYCHNKPTIWVKKAKME
jgi:hypothetical protein